MFEDDNHLVYFSLMQWAKYIETGSFTGMDKQTILELAETSKDMKKEAENLPHLSRDQQEFVYRLQDLAKKILNDKPLEKGLE